MTQNQHLFQFETMPRATTISLLQRLIESIVDDLLREQRHQHVINYFDEQDAQLIIGRSQHSPTVARNNNGITSSNRQLNRYRRFWQTIKSLPWLRWFRRKRRKATPSTQQNQRPTPVNQHPAYQEFIAQALITRVDDNLWRKTIGSFLENEIGGVPETNVPAIWWQMIAGSAWLDLTFQHKVAHKIRAYLRQNTIFEVNTPPLISHVSIQTFWILLAFSTVREPPTAASPLLQNATQKLYQMAITHSEPFEGAEAWDKWLIQRAYKRWYNAFTKFNILYQETLSNYYSLGEE